MGIKTKKRAGRFRGGNPMIYILKSYSVFLKIKLFGGANYFEKMPSCRGFVIWDKKLTDNWTLAMCEYAFCSIDTTAKIFRASLSEGVRKEGERIHICQKPIKLYKWLLKNYAKPGDKILDTHGGSFGLIIACIEMGFDATTYEIDKDYFDAAVKRVKNHVAQLDAFIKPPEITIK